MNCLKLLLIFTLPAVVVAQDSGWPVYGHDQGGARFSPLTQINTTNVAEVELAWLYRHGDLDKHPERAAFAGLHVTPILRKHLDHHSGKCRNRVP